MPLCLPENCFLDASWHAIDAANWDFGIGSPTTTRGRDGPKWNAGYLYPDCQRSGIYELDLYLLEHEQVLLSKDDEFRCWFWVCDGARQV